MPLFLMKTLLSNLNSLEVKLWQNKLKIFLTELRLVGPSRFKWHFVQFCTRRYYPLKYEVFSLKSFFLGEQEPWIKFAKIYKFSTSFINETVLAGGSEY